MARGLKMSKVEMKMQEVTMSKRTRAELVAELAALKAELKLAGKTVSFKVSEKGGVSMYGLGRFPVTLYLSQWQMVINNIEGLKEFLEANKDRLATKK